MLHKKMSELLKHKSIRITDFRVKVLDVFEKNTNAVSVKTIENTLGEYDRTTLFRTLNTFIDKGLIHEVQLPNEGKMLALCSHNCNVDGHEHEHIHFKCNSCKEVFCREPITNPIIEIEGFIIQKVEINAVGICKNCIVD